MKDIKEVQESKESLFDENASGIFSKEEFIHLKVLENKRKELLELEVTKWRLKNWATWLAEGDNNTHLFHKDATFWKKFNTIWELEREDGTKILTFKFTFIF